MPLNFFCHKVAIVTDNKAINADKRLIIEILSPISKPKTKIISKNPKIIPNDYFQLTSSLRKSSAKILIKIGCIVTIKTAILAYNSNDMAKNIL